MLIVRSNYIERRQDIRFKLNEGIFAQFYKSLLVKLGISRRVKSAPVIDLGVGGLTFQYISRNMWTLDFDELSISKHLDKAKIITLPFIAVSDFPISRLPDKKFLRRCGVKFGELTLDQKYLLHYLIQDYKISNYPVDRRTGKDRRRLEVFKPADAGNRNGVERRKRRLYK